MNPIIYDSPHLTLRSFCQWQHQNNDISDKSLKHHDTAVLITRRKLCGTRKPCTVVGLANVGQICNPEHSCLIVQDTGLGTAFTIAHELGHVMGIPHDDQSDCVKFYKERNERIKKPDKKPKNDYIMASVQTGINRVWTWSSCSRHFITKHLKNNGKCLLENQNFPETYSPLQRFGGRYFNVDQQCKLRFDQSKKSCKGMDICKRLWCADSRGGCMSDNTPWADGTECGTDKWCYQGECVPFKDPLRPVDGQWSPWGPWSDCSKPCGGGVQSSKRNCNKPKPKNGGRYCLGMRIRTKPCNQTPCKPSKHIIMKTSNKNKT